MRGFISFLYFNLHKKCTFLYNMLSYLKTSSCGFIYIAALVVQSAKL